MKNLNNNNLLYIDFYWVYIELHVFKVDPLVKSQEYLKLKKSVCLIRTVSTHNLRNRALLRTH